MKVKISLVVVLATLIGASLAFGDGFNLTSWPLIPHDTAIQPVMADSMGLGCQLTGGNNPTLSDVVKWYEASTGSFYSAWYKTGGPGPDFLWKGTLTTIEPDRGYWITIKTGHPAVTLTMTGSVNTACRYIHIEPGLSFNFVGYAFATPCSLSGPSGDDAQLLASGLTGGNNPTQSDVVKYFDGSGWLTAWYKTGGPGPDFLWKGTLKTLDPGNGIQLQVQAGHAFIGNQWVLCAPPAYKGGGKVVLGSKSRTHVKREVSKHVRRASGPSTSKSLAPERTVENKRTR